MRLVTRPVQALSMARTMPAIIDIVRKAARDISRADGATFILRDGRPVATTSMKMRCRRCGKARNFRSPTACVSGWTMLNHQPVVIEDIYQDDRVPHDAYRPTFVQSLVMVPICTERPIGAIGIYWAERHVATESEVELLSGAGQHRVGRGR